jgi:hypothetical protein
MSHFHQHVAIFPLMVLDRKKQARWLKRRGLARTWNSILGTFLPRSVKDPKNPPFFDLNADFPVSGGTIRGGYSPRASAPITERQNRSKKFCSQSMRQVLGLFRCATDQFSAP